MLARTREQWREFLALIPTDDTPILVDLVTAEGEPWSVTPRVVGIGVCTELADNTWRTAYVPLHHKHGANADPGFLSEVLTALAGRPLYVEDVRTFTQDIVASWRFLPAVHTDFALARLMLEGLNLSLPKGELVTLAAGTPEDYDRVRPLQLAVLHDTIGMLRGELDERGLRIPYQVELHAVQVLARSTVHGYQIEDTRVHPQWSTLHPSGSTLVTASMPSVTSMPLPTRRRMVADPYFRWVEVRWPPDRFQVGTVAARCRAPWLVRAALSTSPYAVLAELWRVPENEAQQTFLALTVSGPDADYFCERGYNPDMLHDLAKAAPEWVEWGASLTRDAEQHGSFKGFLGRRVACPQPRKASMLDVQVTQTTLLKMLISRLYVEAEQQPEKFAGFHGVLPVHSKVAYQIDAHVPVGFHVPLARACATLFPAPEVPLLAEVYMGATWGGVSRVDHLPEAQAQAEQDLSQPGRSAIQCPICDQVAPDEPTYQQHLAEAHAQA